MKVEVKDLRRTFGKAVAVDDISFEFSSGNVFGFIGPNGAGKTTTIRIMATLDNPDKGDVFYDGVSAVLYPEEIRRFVGYMPDSLPSYKDIQVWEYLDFFARSFGMHGVRRTKALAEIEEFTDLGEIRTKYLASLSKGMKQRVSLARALVHNPKVLIMDEPAAGLDPRARLELRSLIKVLSSQKKAILLSSHILSELQDICDGAVIIEKGKLLYAGTLNQLLAKTRSGGKSSTGVKKTEEQETILVRAGRETGAADTGKEVTQDEGTEGGIPTEVLTVEEETLLSTVVVKTASDQADSVRLKLLEHPAVRNAEAVDDNEVRATIAGSDQEVSRVIGTLFAADLTILGFRRDEIGLEELFMQITTGKVQ